MNHRLLLRLAVALALTGLSSSAATLSVSPSIITNDFSGKITLTVGALPSAGQTIRVDKFYDLATNGVVDATDPLLQSYFIKDGAVPLIGGATNLNVPFDTDAAANGQIVVALNQPGMERLFGLLEGPYLFRVSSPSNSFTAVQQGFTVRQRTYAQSLSGLAFDAGTLAGLANAFAIAFDADFNPVTAAKANSAGRYTLYLPPGDYTIWPLLNGYLTSQQGWAGKLLPGIPISTASVALASAPYSLAGSVQDAVTGAGLPGAPVLAYQANSLVTVAFPSTNGSFSLKVSSAEWEASPLAESLATRGYVGPREIPRTNVAGNSTGFNLAAEKVDALIHGVIRDNQSPAAPLASVLFGAADSTHQHATTGLSYAPDGRYSVGVVAGNWWLEPSRETLANSNCLAVGTNWVVLPGSAARVDVTSRRVTAHLTGSVRDEFGLPVSGATLRATDPTGAWVVTATADLVGAFDFGLFAGDWRVNLDPATAADWYLVGYDLNRSLTDGQTLAAQIYRLRYANGSGSGSVRDAQGQPMRGINVRATTTLGGTNYSAYATTDVGGSYWLPTVVGTWMFTADCFGSGGLSFQGCNCAAGVSAAVVGSDANLFPTITANAMTPPALGQPVVTQGTSFTFSVSGATNRTFQVLTATNLDNWGSVFATNPPGGRFQFTATNIASPRTRAYRVLAQ